MSWESDQIMGFVDLDFKVVAVFDNQRRATAIRQDIFHVMRERRSGSKTFLFDKWLRERMVLTFEARYERHLRGMDLGGSVLIDLRDEPTLCLEKMFPFLNPNSDFDLKQVSAHLW